MSQSDRDGRGAARQRLAAERQRQAAKERRRKQVTIVTAIVAAIAVVVGLGVLLQANRAQKRSADFVAAPAGATSGQAVSYGKASAPVTMTIYQDYRCPACQQFETAFGPTLTDLVNAGTLKIDYHLVRLIDRPGQTGSLNAANAAICANDAGKFGQLNQTLYASQPSEASDPWADKNAVLDVARKVPGLVTPEFQSCVNTGKHNAEVEQMWQHFKQVYPRAATPTVILGQDELTGATRGANASNLLASPETLKAEINAEAAGKGNQ